MAAMDAAVFVVAALAPYRIYRREPSPGKSVMPKAHVNGISIEHDSFGSEDAEPILLISGLGVQMIRWTAPFCEKLAAQGFHVIRFDNRDVGLSTHFADSPVPDLAAVASALARGERPDVPYTLDDMADDAVALLDALGIKRAHIVGRSMGGMIAQIVASEHPERTLTLTSIMSSSGNPGLPPSSPEAMAVLTQRAPIRRWMRRASLIIVSVQPAFWVAPPFPSTKWRSAPRPLARPNAPMIQPVSVARLPLSSPKATAARG